MHKIGQFDFNHAYILAPTRQMTIFYLHTYPNLSDQVWVNLSPQPYHTIVSDAVVYGGLKLSAHVLKRTDILYTLAAYTQDNLTFHLVLNESQNPQQMGGKICA